MSDLLVTRFFENPQVAGTLPASFQPFGCGLKALFSSCHMKGRDGADLKPKEDTMKLVTRFELAAKNTRELHLLYRDIFNSLVHVDHETKNYRNCFASLENIRQEIKAREQSQRHRPSLKF